MDLHLADLQEELRSWYRTQDTWWLPGLCLPGVSFHTVNVAI